MTTYKTWRELEEQPEGVLMPITITDAPAGMVVVPLAEYDRVRKALEWYEKIVGECNRKDREGDDARNALAQDIGQRARAAL